MKERDTFIICIFLLTCLFSCQQQNTHVETWYATGKQWHKANQIDSAIHYYYRAESAITLATNPELKTKVYLNIADLLQCNNHYNLALDYYQKALDVFEAEGDQRMAAYTLTDMGACRQRRKDSIPAIRACYDRALAIAPDDTVTGDIIQQIGLLYYFQHELDSARHYLHRSLDYPYWKKYKQSVSLLFLGTSFYETGQLDTAEHYLLQALDCEPELRQQDGCYKILYKIAMKRGDMANVAALYAVLPPETSYEVPGYDQLFEKDDRVVRVIGDSFSEYYMPYLEARFAGCWREHIDTFDPALADQPGCDILILEFNERSLDTMLSILSNFYPL